MSTLAEIGDYLEFLGLGIQKPTPVPTGEFGLFLGSRPEAPDQVITLYQYPGGRPEYVQEQHMPIAETPQVQVVVRANDYETAERRASRVWLALASVTNATLGGTRYRSIRPNASPSNMGRDTNDRNLVFFNCTVDKEVSFVS